MIASVTECLFTAISNYICVGCDMITIYEQLVLDAVLIINGKDYPSTLLPGVSPNKPGKGLLNTVRFVYPFSHQYYHYFVITVQIEVLNGVVHCVQQNYLTHIRSICKSFSYQSFINNIQGMYDEQYKKVRKMSKSVKFTLKACTLQWKRRCPPYFRNSSVRYVLSF